MVRALAAKDRVNSSNEQKSAKRRCVQSACVPCRKRKSKCDGATPVCATCTAVYKTDCFYDAESESRRTQTPQKRDSSALTEPTGTTALIINSIRTLPEAEVQEFIQHIRKDDNIDLSSLVESLKKSVTLPPKPVLGHTSLEGELSVLMGKPAVTQSGVSRHFGHTSALGLVTEDENYSRPRSSSPNTHRQLTWTNVTDDRHFVLHLLHLYFTWSHPFYVLFPRECFYKDFRSGRDKYCSSLLVNAICAYSCHFSDDPKARTNPDDSRTAGDHFFSEAKRLLFEDESPCLTTVQALAVLGIREPSAGRDSSGFMYAGRCLRMAVELGLHLNYTPSSMIRLTPSEVEVRRVTFWGCFAFDTAWSLCVGRISQLPRAAISLDKPVLNEPLMDEPILVDKSKGFQGQSQPVDPKVQPGQATSRLFLQQLSTLSEFINDNVFLFYAPRERFTSRRLLDCYDKYKSWYKSLPRPLCIPEDYEVRPQAHILTLHMYYYTCNLHLFRPLLKVDLIHSDIRPRDMCIESANRISEILRIYRKHYSLRACNLLLTHILLSMCTVHLIESAHSELSANYLVEGLEALEATSIAHHFGARCFKIIWKLSQEWDLPFPGRLKNSTLIPHDHNPVTSPSAMNFFALPGQTATAAASTNSYTSVSSRDLSDRRESLSMFASPPEHRSIGLPTTQSCAPLSVSLPSPAASSSLPFTPSSIPTPLEQQLFWTPMEGMGVPLLSRTHQVSPMDLSNMLRGVGEWERLSLDGFKMSDSWISGPTGFGGGNEHMNHPSHLGNSTGAESYHTWWGNGAPGNGVG